MFSFFKPLWEDDYQRVYESARYQRGRNFIFKTLLVILLIMNYIMFITPANAYNGTSSFTVEDFADYQDIEQCYYGIDSTGTAPGTTMTCVSLGNVGVEGQDYEYVRDGQKLYQTNMFIWINDDDLGTGKFFTYYNSLVGTPILTQTTDADGNVIFSPTATDYLKETGSTWNFYNILQYVPGWVSDNTYIYNYSDKGNLYYSIANNPNDSYYRYDREGNIVYNQYADIGKIYVNYIYLDGNEFMYGKPTVDNYNNDYVTLTNVKEAYYQLQTYEQTHITTDFNGIEYGEEGFDDNSYFKDGIYYLWDASEERFYAYEIDTLHELGFIHEDEVEAQKDGGNTIITKDSADKLMSNVRKYKEYYETIYSISSSETTSNGLTDQPTLDPSSTGNSYTYYDVSETPTYYDTVYNYLWTYVSEYSYLYSSTFNEQEYQYEYVSQEKTSTETTSNTYSLVSNGSENTIGDVNISNSNNTLCSTLSSLSGSGIKCYTQTNTGKYRYSFSTTINTYSKTSNSNLYSEIDFDKTKEIYFGTVRTTIYHKRGYAENAGWFYIDGNSQARELEKLTTDTYVISVTSKDAGTTETDDGNSGWNTNVPNFGSVSSSNKSGTYYINDSSASYREYQVNYQNYYKTYASQGTVSSISSPGNVYSSVEEGLEKTSAGNYFYIKLTSNWTDYNIYTRDVKLQVRPQVFYLKTSYHTDNFEYWAAYVASFKNGAPVITNVHSSDPGHHMNCDGICLEKSTGPTQWAVWYKITATEYTNESFNPVGKTAQKVPTNGGGGGLFSQKNMARDYKWGYNKYDPGKFTSISVPYSSSGNFTLYYGSSSGNDISQSTSISSITDTDYAYYFSNNTLQSNYLRSDIRYTYNLYVTTSDWKYATKYTKYYVSEGSSIDKTKKSKGLEGSKYYLGTNNSSYFYNFNGTNYYSGQKFSQDATNTEIIDSKVSKIRDYTKYHWTQYNWSATFTSKTDETGYFRIKYGNKYYYFKNGENGNQLITNHDTYSNYRTYSNGAGASTKLHEANGGIITIKTTSYSSSSNVSIYKEVVVGSLSVSLPVVGANSPGASASDAVNAWKSINGVVNATASGSNVILTLVDGSTHTATKDEYKTYNYYISQKTNSSYNNDNGSFANVGNVSIKNLTVSEMQNYRNEAYKDERSDSPVTKDTPSTTGAGTISISTTITTVKTQKSYRTYWKFKQLVDSNRTVTLYSLSPNSNVPKTDSMGNKGYTGYNSSTNQMTGSEIILNVSCGTSNTSPCYRFTNSTTFIKQWDEKKQTVLVSGVEYRQTVEGDLSNDSSNPAYYMNHMPNKDGYAKRICESSTDTSCYENNPKVTYSTTKIYSYTKHVITYTISSAQNEGSISFGEQSSNSTLNTYQEYGTLTGGKYNNAGNVTGGTYTFQNSVGGISSINIFNQNAWFMNASVSNSVKNYSNGAFNYSGNGTISYNLTGYEANNVYTISFKALSANGGTLEVWTGNVKRQTFNLSSTYPGTRQSISYTPSSYVENITFKFSNGLSIKEIAVVKGNSAVYSQYATYTLGNVTDTFYQTYSINETYSYYNVLSPSDANGFDLNVSTNVIGYNNTIYNQNGWEEGLINQNQESGIKYNYVLYGYDFNKDGQISTSERYSGTNVLPYVCLDEKCTYRYLKTGTSADLSYTRTRIVKIAESNYSNYLDKESMQTIDSVNSSSLEGSNTTINSNEVSDLTSVVKVNGKYYDINTDYGRYQLFLEYFTTNSGTDKSLYTYQMSTNTIFRITDSKDSYKFLVSHDDNKLYNAVTKEYDKLDKGYTKVTIYESADSLKDLIEGTIDGFLVESGIATIDGKLTWTQEKLFAIYQQNNSLVQYTCKDKNGGVTLENCTFTYVGNTTTDGENTVANEEITLDDVLNGHVNGGSLYGLILNNELFNSINNPYFSKNGEYYKLSQNLDVTGFKQYEKYYYGGYWQKTSIENYGYIATTNENYAIISAKYTKNGSELVFYNLKEDPNFYTEENTKLYILKNNAGTETETSIYSNDSTQKYFYVWASGDLSSKYSNYKIVDSYTMVEIYKEVMTKQEEGTNFATRYLVVDVVRIALKEALVIENEAKSLYKLQKKSDYTGLVINNIISLSELQEIDLSKSIIATEVAGGTDDTIRNSASYALKFSGMMNYWNATINGGDILEIDENGDCTLSALQVKQKTSSIKIGEDDVPEFLLLNRGTSNSFGHQNIYDLYGLTQVLETDETGSHYYRITHGGSSGDNVITQFVQALNILEQNGYTGYMFENDSNADFKSAESQLKQLPKSIFDWSLLARNPKLAQDWFENSSLANLIYYNYAGKNSGGVQLYNAQTAFNSNYDEHFEYYKEIFAPLFSAYLFGYVYSDYQKNHSLPNVENLISDSPTTQEVNGTEDYVKTINSLIETIIKENMSRDGFDYIRDSESKSYFSYPQAVGAVIDSYMYINYYRYAVNHVYNNPDDVVIEENILSMIPALNYSSSVKEAIDNMEEILGQVSIEMQLTNLLDYINYAKTNEYMFVKSDTSDRYYIYTKLESTDGFAPSATVIRQNTTVTNEGYSKYNDSNNIITINEVEDKIEYMTLQSSTYNYLQTIEPGIGDVFGGLFGGKGFAGGDTAEGNKLYAYIYNGTYKGTLRIAMLSNLTNYIVTSDSINTKYKPITYYSSYISQNPPYIYDWLDVSVDELYDNASTSCGISWGVPDDWCKSKEGIVDAFEDLVTGRMSGSVLVSPNEFNMQYVLPDGTIDTETGKMLDPSNFIAIRKGETYNDKVCQTDYCVSYGTSVRYNFDDNYNSGGVKLSVYRIDNSMSGGISYTAFVLTFQVNIDSIPSKTLYKNGHYVTTDGTYQSSNSFEIDEQTNINSLVDFEINNINNDSNYQIGLTDFSITFGNVRAENNKFAINSVYEYSLKYEAKVATVCADNFMYNAVDGYCYYVAPKADKSLVIHDIGSVYEIESYYDYTNIITGEVVVKERSLVYVSNKTEATKEEIENAFEEYVGVNFIEDFVFMSELLKNLTYEKTSLRTGIYNATTAEQISITNLPEKTTFIFSARNRFASGAVTNPFTEEFTTSDDNVMNPYGNTLSDIDGTLNGDNLLKNEVIPYTLQKCLFSFDNEPTREGYSTCGEYQISNKYRMQVTDNETIRVAFALVNSKGELALNSNEILRFVEDINTKDKKYHTVNGKVDVMTSNGIFYYEFNEEDFAEFAKYNSTIEFVNSYILQKYTIELSNSLYDKLNKVNETYTLKVMDYYAPSYIYLDYNQNGVCDEVALTSEIYYSKDGIQTYYETTNKLAYEEARLAISGSVENVNSSWYLSQLFIGSDAYPQFKIGKYVYTNETGSTISYYIFGYDPNSGSHIIK